MATATGSSSALGYRLETTYGVAPTGVLYHEFRRKSAAGLNLTKDTYDSEEVRSDRQLADSRHGIRRAGGDVETEISPLSYDDFWLALLGHGQCNAITPGSGWTAGSSLTYTEAVTFDATANTILMTSTPSNFKRGDRVVVTNAVDSANNRTYLILSISGNTLTVDDVPADETADMVTIQVAGKRALTGNYYNSFTLERAFTDIDQYQHFTGMRPNSVAVTLPATGIATATWNFIGKEAAALDIVREGTNSAYGYVSTYSPLDAVNGSLAIYDSVNGGRTLAVVTDMNFTIDNQMGGAELIGSNTIRETVWGITQMITGKITVLFEDEKLYNLFMNEQEAMIHVSMIGPGTQSDKFLSFTFPRCRFNTGNIGDAVNTGLPVEMEFRALLPSSADTTSHQKQVMIQTSTS